MDSFLLDIVWLASESRANAYITDKQDFVLPRSRTKLACQIIRHHILDDLNIRVLAVDNHARVGVYQDKMHGGEHVGQNWNVNPWSCSSVDYVITPAVVRGQELDFRQKKFELTPMPAFPRRVQAVLSVWERPWVEDSGKLCPSRSERVLKLASTVDHLEQPCNCVYLYKFGLCSQKLLEQELAVSGSGLHGGLLPCGILK